jgi:hypothetical protein
MKNNDKRCLVLALNYLNKFLNYDLNNVCSSEIQRLSITQSNVQISKKVVVLQRSLYDISASSVIENMDRMVNEVIAMAQK